MGKITARRQQGDKVSTETRYYLLSQAFTPQRFNDIVRSHWGIANQLHWSLDVVFNEDLAATARGIAPRTCPCCGSWP